MAVTSSGMIGLNEIHVEAGGGSGAACTINDSDIRGLIGKSSGVMMGFNEWYGASSSLDTQTITVGVQTPAYTYYPTIYGYFVTTTTVGSLSDGTSDIYSGSAIQNITWNSNQILNFVVYGQHSNSGWTTMNIAGASFSRTSATYSQISDRTTWQWSSISTNPIGTTSGATKVVTFT